MFQFANSQSSKIALLAMVPVLAVACQKSGAGESGKQADASTPVASLEVQTDQKNQKGLFAWSTQAAVPSAIDIEVGDHPPIKLDEFQIGGRAQRVRYFAADDRTTMEYYSSSPQDRLFLSDAAIGKTENSKWSIFAMIIEPAANLGLMKFSDVSLYNGVAVSPQLAICATSALANLREAAKTRARAYQSWQIDMTNIFVKTVQHASQAESRMAIDPHLRALNFQVSMWTRNGDCFLPSVESVGEALDIADQRVED